MIHFKNSIQKQFHSLFTQHWEVLGVWKFTRTDPAENQNPDVFICTTLSRFLLIVLICPCIRLIHWLERIQHSPVLTALISLRLKNKQVTGVLWILENWGLKKTHWHTTAHLVLSFPKYQYSRRSAAHFSTTYGITIEMFLKDAALNISVFSIFFLILCKMTSYGT